MAMTFRLRAALPSLVLLASAASAQAAPAAGAATESFYATSLHFTNRGIEFVYSKTQGGLEVITGLPASEVGCVKAECHAASCDACHRRDKDGKAAYTTDPAVAQAACERCHGAPEADGPDVHARKGMKCMSCHSTREVHGDGVAYDTYSQPGVLDTRCERCHADLSKSASHTIHRDTVACAACHTAKIDTCVNCHVETRLGNGKETKIPLQGMLFLVNHDGRVTTANLLSYVYKGRTMITLAPTFAHSVVRQGRACAECHDSAIVRAISAGTFTPVTWADGKAANVKGVIPVLDPAAWRLPFLDRRDGSWVPLADGAPPVVHFSGSCAPLTREQLARLATPRRAK
ncbi:MAG TPA: hypothetical protein VMT19_05495 [Thermoanaerobaculaceae bacterium]|nr:hypothetical protein [Thermoanaerobaculaceae bacterium]